MHDATIKKNVKEAWNIGGPGLYEEHLEHLEHHPENNQNVKIYMTKIYKDFACNVFYPMKTWNRLQAKFQELTASDDIQINSNFQ